LLNDIQIFGKENKMTLFNFNGSLDTDTIENGIKDFIKGTGISNYREWLSFQPRCDVYGDEKKIFLEMELPGIEKENIKIKFEKNILTISGEKKKHSEKSEDKNIFINERRFGKFERSFTLSDAVDSNNIEAKFENGVLYILIPKLEEQPSTERKIDIK
jgi:HSP20 family protein